MYTDCFLLLKAAGMHAQLPVQRAAFSLIFHFSFTLSKLSISLPTPAEPNMTAVDNKTLFAENSW